MIELRAQMAVTVNQSRFWTREWQRREQEADADLEAGRHTTYDDADSFLDSLPE